MSLNFTIESRSGLARAGNLTIRGITVPTPVFMPVGTRGTVKAVTQEMLREIDYQLILGNTYHLYLRPGTDVLSSFGGLSKFMSWDKLLLTDSGGYQAFSLSANVKYQSDGVLFRSHLDGSAHLFTPQKVLEIQNVIGSDIVMPIDDCAPYPSAEPRLRESLTRTHSWISQSKEFFYSHDYNLSQNLFAIVQGGVNEKLRAESAQFAASLDLPGYAIGGLSVGEKNEEFLNALAVSCNNLPDTKPRYLMGVGSIPEIIKAVELGVDMMDCVLPTRNARNGQVFTSYGKVNLRNESLKNSKLPIDEECGCMVCRNYAAGYLRHLHKTGEILAYTLSTYHNLYFMRHFMLNLRQAIVEDRFAAFKAHWISLF